ncbi:MocR-like ectoine utilization transcription factor EhuR [Marinobacterium arenosum]|uniref:MocR-like ectoine utilization transcription factor EhuR n=1 Tax=Marinobacterium arenosum TaxID=2862496 RepID=UPI001C97F4F8|nr:PLP-dependent aminotransferase family protein [Marinobacterium arenosum]MBY4679039.1 PLP-dependent aminotransferase family protein [Marinobacterium arenosum]
MTILEDVIREQLTSSRSPRYQAIAEAICKAIDQGILHASEKLPTHRALAEAIGVSIQTVSYAYAFAEQEGYVVGKVGSGTYVSHQRAQQEVDFLKNGAPKSNEFVDLSIVYATAGEAQESAFADALRDIASQPEGRELINAIKPFAGLMRHREAAARWLAKLGLDVPAEQVCITNGATHALLTAMASLVHPGDNVACAELVDHGLISLARTLNFRLEGVALDEQGIIPEALATLCEQKQIAAICVTPTLNNPTGQSMSLARRQAIAEIARRFDIPLVEDDVFATIQPQPLPPISSLVPELGYYITSFTKVIAAGLRIGYLVPPHNQVAPVTGRLRASSWMASPISAGIASHWIDSGKVDALAEWQRGELRSRYQLACDILKLPADETIKSFILLPLPEPWRVDDFVNQARQQKVLLTPAEPFVVGHQPAPHFVRLSLTAAASRDELTRGLQVVAQLLKQTPPPISMEYLV